MYIAKQLPIILIGLLSHVQASLGCSTPLRNAKWPFPVPLGAPLPRQQRAGICMGVEGLGSLGFVGFRRIGLRKIAVTRWIQGLQVNFQLV